jgi:hypothetical protein
LANEDAKDLSTNHFTAKWDFESVFQAYPTFLGTHSFSDAHSITGSVTTYLSISSLEIDLNWNFALGALTISPGVGTTFGPASWTFSQSDKRILIGRDITPFIELNYRSSLFEADSFSQFWFPIQEAWPSSIGFGESRLWGVVKYSELGVGPHMVAFFTKEGSRGYYLSNFWIGAHLLARLDNAVLHLFLGYDTISNVWLGAPKPAGPYFRATVAYTI